MTETPSFHEVRFPTGLAMGAAGGPERSTEIITLGSGREQRNARWAGSRRRYNAGYGVKTIADLQAVVEFFEERRGRLYGFRFRDPLDHRSSRGSAPVAATDQVIGNGDGSQQEFQLLKRYGTGDTQYIRKILKPVDGTVAVSVDGTLVPESSWHIDTTSGVLQFDNDWIPLSGSVVSAGFEFDVPVRFDMDEITINLKHFRAGDIASIPMVELMP